MNLHDNYNNLIPESLQRQLMEFFFKGFLISMRQLNYLQFPLTVPRNVMAVLSN